MGNFKDELIALLNRYSKENGSDTPDWILADYLTACLENFDATFQKRKAWYSPEGIPDVPAAKV